MGFRRPGLRADWLVYAVRVEPHFLYLANHCFSPLAGVVTDRQDRRWVMILADAGAGIGTLSILLALWFWKLELWHIYLVTAIIATANTFQWPAYGAATTMLVPKSQLGRAGGMVQIGEALSQLVTPAAAGTLFVTIGMRGIVLIDLSTLILAVCTLFMIHIPMPERTSQKDDEKVSFLGDMTYGWRYLAARPGLLGLLIYFAIGNFFASAAFAMFTPMMLDMTTPDLRHPAWRHAGCPSYDNVGAAAPDPINRGGILRRLIYHTDQQWEQPGALAEQGCTGCPGARVLCAADDRLFNYPASLPVCRGVFG